MTKELSEFLRGPIAYYRVLATLTGSAKAALLLSQAIYWQYRCTATDGFWWKTVDAWEKETGLTRHEQESARRDCGELLIIERRGLPSQNWFRVNETFLLTRLTETGAPVSLYAANKSVSAQQPTRSPENGVSNPNSPRTGGNRTVKEPKANLVKLTPPSEPESGPQASRKADRRRAGKRSTTNDPKITSETSSENKAADKKPTRKPVSGDLAADKAKKLVTAYREKFAHYRQRHDPEMTKRELAAATHLLAFCEADEILELAQAALGDSFAGNRGAAANLTELSRNLERLRAIYRPEPVSVKIDLEPKAARRDYTPEEVKADWQSYLDECERRGVKPNLALE